MTPDNAPIPFDYPPDHIGPLLTQGAHPATAAGILRALSTLGPRDLSAITYPSGVVVRMTVPPIEGTTTLAAWLAANPQ